MFQHQMVNFALLNGGVVYASQVDRRTQSNLRVDVPYTCFGCKHPLIHKNGTKITAHFAHKHSDCAHCKDCEYFVGKIFGEPSTFKESEMGTDLVKKWQNCRPYYPDFEEGRVYNHGSEKAKITIFNDVRDEESKRIIENINPPRVVILNAECLGLELYLTNDSGQYWVRFQNKSFIDDILQKKAIVLIDSGSPLLLRLNSLKTLDSVNYDGENTKYLDQCYACDLIDVATAIKEYFPDDYTFTHEQSGELVKAKMIQNNIERKKQEAEAEALRLAYEQKEKTELLLAREKQMKEEKEAELIRIREQKEKDEATRRIASELCGQDFYTPHILNNRDEVKTAYLKFISKHNSAPQNTLYNFANQVAKDGTKYMDVTQLKFPHGIDVNSGFLSYVMTTMREFIKT